MKTDHKWVELGPRFNIAGTQYADLKKCRGSIRLGQQVRFVGQPSNQYDNKAVKVLYGEKHIGFVPMNSAVKFAMWDEHAAQSRLIGVVTALQLNFSAVDYVQIQVLVLS